MAHHQIVYRVSNESRRESPRIARNAGEMRDRKQFGLTLAAAVSIPPKQILILQWELQLQKHASECRKCEITLKLLDWLIELLIRLREKIAKRNREKHICKASELAFLMPLAFKMRVLGFQVPVTLLMHDGGVASESVELRIVESSDSSKQISV